jgi:hypothetical protein
MSSGSATPLRDNENDAETPTDSGFASKLRGDGLEDAREPKIWPPSPSRLALELLGRARSGLLRPEARQTSGETISIEIQRVSGAHPTAYRVTIFKDTLISDLHAQLYGAFPVFTPPVGSARFLFAGQEIMDLSEVEDGCVVHLRDLDVPQLSASGGHAKAGLAGPCRPSTLLGRMSSLNLAN